MLTESIKYVKKPRSILRTITIGTIALLIFGFLIDLFSGFPVLRNSKSIYAGLAGLFFLAVFYLIDEAGGDWISSKDDVSHPLYKRAFRLAMLLIYAGIIMTAGWFILNYFGLIKT
jgi:hypothetical protein